MEQEVLRAIEGIDIYPVISLLMFFVFFAAVIVYVIKADTGYMSKMSRMPLDNSNENEDRKAGI